MSISIEKLRREHRNLKTVLDLAEMDLAELERNPASDRALFRRALDYLRHYFDQVHHPHEDLIFDYVDARRCESHQTVLSHAAGHKAIYQLGDILDDWLDHPHLPGEALPVDVAAVCRRYLQLQRESLEAEERVMFPVAEQCLTAGDWRAIEAHHRVQEKLPGADRIALRYGALRQFLMTAR